MEDSNPELESFRQQWRAEVTARTKQGDDGGNSATKRSRKHPAVPRLPGESSINHLGNNGEATTLTNAPPLTETDGDDDEFKPRPNGKEPRSALEHYERAVEMENKGTLGDSLNLYRKAFRLDPRVDQAYKNKYFPPSTKPSVFTVSPTTVSTTSNNAQGPKDLPSLTTQQLIKSFITLTIEPAAPEIEGTPAPPCYIANLPQEIIVQICQEVAILDVAAFAGLARVCKYMAYLVSTEEQIWKRLCLGHEVGFEAMHYKWQREVNGRQLEEVGEFEVVDGTVARPVELSKDNITVSLLRDIYSSSWREMFRKRPRIRFDGCYISTVNYIRAGQASQSLHTWANPVHVVTYYRYLRFFRDGTLLSLLTTTEPADVVHYLTKGLLDTHRGGAASYLPSAFMKNALPGRWHLSGPNNAPEVDLQEAEGDVFIETEGVGPKYMYRMELSLRNTGRTRNNKLTWKGFWNYNRLTDDWAEFTLRNDKAFFWSRVKSYGTGA